MVRPDQLFQFFAVHADSILACHNAASLHWRIHAYFEAEGDHRAMAALWNHSRHCRLHDVVLLEQRFRLARSGRRALPSPLDQLLGFSPGMDQGFVIDPTHADTIIDAIAEHYETYHGNARNLAAGLGVSPETIARFGPLGTGRDAQGAIAFQRVQCQGLLVHRDAVEELRHRVLEAFQRASEELGANAISRNCFKWERDLVKRDRRGIPEIHKSKLRNWLAEIGESLRDYHNARWALPFNDQGELSLVPSHWGTLLKCDTRLAAWRDLMASGQAIQSLTGGLDQVVFPKYATVPEIQPIGLDFAWLKQFGVGFQPRRGHRFVVITLNDLELRCYARICETRYHPPDVKLAFQFRSGQNPIGSLSEWLFRRRNAAGGRSLGELVDFDRHIITRTVLIGVVRGLSDTQIREWLRQDLRNSDIGGADIARLRRLILEEHHELEYFLEDPTIPQLAWRLGQDEKHLIRSLITDEIDATSGQAIRNVLEGRRRGQPVWEVLRTLGRTERDRELLTSESPGPESLELLWGWPTTFAGRVDRPVICTQTRAAEFLASADEIRQSVAYEIVAAGWKLSAVINDEFIIEVPAESNDVEESLTALVEEVIRPELGGLANNCCSVRETFLV